MPGAEDPRPLDDSVPCPASREYSRAYLHHLVRSGEILGSMLLSWHNVAYYQHLMAGMRQAIVASAFALSRRAFPVRTRKAMLSPGRQASPAAARLTPTLSQWKREARERAGDGGPRSVMSDTENQELTQLDRPAAFRPRRTRPAAGNRADPHADLVYLVRFTCPELACAPLPASRISHTW